MTGTVLVVGDVMTDVIVRPDGPIVYGSDRSARIEKRPGGSGANQAVWLGAMGAQIVFAGRVGAADLAAQEARFRAAGVVPVLAGDEALGSGVLVTIVDPSGERSFLTDRGANLHLSAEDLPDSLLDGVKLVMVSGYSLFAPGPRVAVQSLLARARGRDVAIAIDPASTGFLAEVGPATFLDWTGGGDWLFANEDEAALLSGTLGLDQQVRRLGKKFTHVVIKRGRLGAIIGGKEGIELNQAAPSVEVVDSTGAGDAFAAGFIASLMDGKALEQCLARGIESGAQAVQQIGGQPR